MEALTGTLVASCVGELLTTTGSSGNNCDCAMNIFAEVPGTEIDGVCELEFNV